MNNTIETLKSLHSTHGNFNDKDIKKEDLETIVNVCLRGANASNRQSYSIIVVEGRENTEKVCGYSAPTALLFCVDFTRLYEIGEHMGYPSDYETLFNYLTAHTDAVILAQTAAIAAASLGMATLYTNSIHHMYRTNLDNLYKELGLPDKHCFPVTALLLGYEDEKPEELRGRLTGKGVVHYGKYQPLSAEDKDEIISYVNNPENNFGSKEDCDTYLDYYYSKWAPPAPAEMSKQMDSLLKAKMKEFLKYI